MIVWCYNCREGTSHSLVKWDAICDKCGSVNGYTIKKKLNL